MLGEFADDLDVLDLQPVRFFCGCSAERVRGMLELLTAEQLEAMIDEDGGAEVTCDFCRERYEVGVDELSAIRETIGPRATS